jgi:Putative Flp pilus-assembly TadE/G-like
MLILKEFTKQFARNERGNVGIMFAMSLIPMLGAAGAAIDYSRASNGQSVLQSNADSAALAVVGSVAGGNDSAAAIHLANARTIAMGRFPTGEVSNIVFTGQWLNTKDYEVTATGKIRLALAKVIPGSGTESVFTSKAVGRVVTTRTVTSPKPAVASLDYEAGDYNRIYAYCYDKTKKTEPSKGRTKMTAISDNGGTNYVYSMPVCDEGETISYRLYNVRGQRTSPSNWDSVNTERFNHYTDTELSKDKPGVPDGVAAYDFTRGDRNNYGVQTDFPVTMTDGLLENVLCDTLAECKPDHQGGIIKTGTDRNPKREKKACSPGKFMYYGWEDRPAYSTYRDGVDNWTDKDYDDIRVIVECPSTTVTVGKKIQLIK